MPEEKILVVDDNKEIVDICIQVLEREGYKVAGVTKGLSAIDLAKKDHFDLLVTDIVMPGINGMEIFRLIREFDPELVGIIITGHASLDTAVDAIKMGFYGFVIKPFSYVELCAAVSQALERRRLEKELVTYRSIYELKDGFLATVSHELQTPLSLILASTDLILLMRCENADDKEKEALGVLKREGSRLARVVSNMLLYSELKFQSVEYPKEPIDLKNITARAIDSLREDTRKKNITIDNRISDTTLIFFGVGRYIKQMIVNFLDNAIKFNRDGGSVTVSAAKEEDHIRYEIDDTGIGIAEESSDRIFNAFEQLEDPLTRKVGGTGLGLAINKEIVEVHGGKMWVQSVPEKGSKFVFTIPITDR